MTFIFVCNVFQESLAFCGKCVLSSFQMCFKSVWHFTGNVFDRPEFTFEEHLAFCGKCLLSSFLVCLKGTQKEL